MKRTLATVLVLCVFLHYGQSVTYKATVVEYRSVPDEANTVLRNVNNYVEQIELTDGDIIVFPEYGLTTTEVFDKSNWKKDYTLHVPKSYEETILCEEEQQVETALKEISCVAKRKEIYVVINFIEKDNSTKKDIFYNTNLVFDRTGKIAAKYRKINLYEEDELTPGKDIVTFQTDFGVKFGIFTCFDILFHHPASEILKNDIEDIVYPTAWISQTPYAISLSVQAGYVKKNNVNLLAANYNNPAQSNGGSGIYRATGFTAYTYISGQHKTSAVAADNIESIANRNRTCAIDLSDRGPGGRDSKGVGVLPNIQDYVTRGTSTEGYVSKYKALPEGETEFKDEICDDNRCCAFEAKTMAKLSVQNGVYKWAMSQKDGATSCALILCKTNDDSTCGERIDEATTASFLDISVKGKFPKNQYTIPITSQVNLNVMYKYSYCAQHIDSNNEDIVMEIYDGIHNDVTAFGIVGYLKGGAGALCCNAIIVSLFGLYASFRIYF